MGNTCKPMADSFQCMTKPTTIKKKKKESLHESTNLGRPRVEQTLRTYKWMWAEGMTDKQVRQKKIQLDHLNKLPWKYLQKLKY